MINVHFIMMYILYFLWDFTDDENVDTEKSDSACITSRTIARKERTTIVRLKLQNKKIVKVKIRD